MDNLECSDCGVTYYSAAASDMVVRGERCDCGGRLVERGQGTAARVPVRAVEEPPEAVELRRAPDPDTGRRFDRPPPTE
jgi:hypothetical protein